MDAELLEDIEGARGHTSRSQFIREAIVEKLRGMGMKISEDMVFPPDRVSVVARVSGMKNTVTQNLSSTSQPARASAKYPPKKRGKRKPEK